MVKEVIDLFIKVDDLFVYIEVVEVVNREGIV